MRLRRFAFLVSPSHSPFEPLPRRPLTKRWIHWSCLAAASFLQSLCFKREILVCCSLDAHSTLFFSQFLLYHPVSSPTTALAFAICFIHSFVQQLQVSSTFLLSVANEISFQHPFSAFSIFATKDSSTKPSQGRNRRFYRCSSV